MADENDIILPDEDVENIQLVHHTSQRKKRRINDDEMELQLTSMIDVIFQLLIYFVITANFTIDEGTLKASMPGQSAPADTDNPDPPIFIDLKTGDDGLTYTLTVDNKQVPGGASELYGYLQSQVDTNKFNIDDDYQIRPQGNVRWQHVVNVFNACTRAELEKVGFATPNQ
ncbi:biopolymer transporter ExbD [Phycisphaeraceae bacterium D3-23]